MNELRPLTGIRGLAAFLVILFHFHGFTALFPSLHLLDFIWSKGGMGVDLFFMLSGFILSYVYSAGQNRLTLGSYGKFIWFRMARLYPNHLATLALLVICLAVAKLTHVQVMGNYPFSALPFQLTLTHAWPYFPGYDGSQWNYPSWSISAEWFAYACIFPVSCVILRGGLLNKFYLPLAYGLLILCLILLRVPGLYAFEKLIRVSMEFLVGSLLFGMYRTTDCRLTGVFQRLLDITVLLMILGLFIFSDAGQGGYVFIILMFPCLLLGLTAESTFVARIFSKPLSLWFGNISYALYMTHAITQKMLKTGLPMERYAHSPAAIRFIILLANLAAIVGVAASLYYAVEVPSRNRLRRIFNSLSKHYPQSVK